MFRLLRRIAGAVASGAPNRAVATKYSAAASGAFVWLDILRVEFEIGDVDGLSFIRGFIRRFIRRGFLRGSQSRCRRDQKTSQKYRKNKQRKTESFHGPHSGNWGARIVAKGGHEGKKFQPS